MLGQNASAILMIISWDVAAWLGKGSRTGFLRTGQGRKKMEMKVTPWNQVQVCNELGKAAMKAVRSDWK